MYVVRNENDPFVEGLRAENNTVLIGDPGVTDTLNKAALTDARSIVIATDDDLKNLSVAGNARAIKPDCHVVLRIFDDALSNKLESAFNIKSAFSATAVAAPSFALAALDPQKSILNVFTVHDEEFATFRITPKKGSTLQNKYYKELYLEFRAQAVRAAGQEIDGGKPRAGRELVMVVPFKNLQAIQALNVEG